MEKLAKSKWAVDGNMGLVEKRWRLRPLFWVCVQGLLSIGYCLIKWEHHIPKWAGSFIYEILVFVLLYLQVRSAQLRGIYIVVNGDPFKKWELVTIRNEGRPHIIYDVVRREDGNTIYGLFSHPIGMRKWERFGYLHFVKVCVFLKLIK